MAEAFRLLVLLISLNNCSGFILNDNQVLTAGHCSEESIINGMPIKPIKVNKWLDVMLVKAQVKGKAKFADAKLGEAIYIVGFTGDLRILTRGHVAGFKDEYLYLDILTLKGESGAAVYNLKGQVVGMVVGGLSDGYTSLTVALSTKSIKEFLK